MKKIYSFLFMVLAAMTVNAKTIYLDATNWAYSDAAFVAHVWNANDDATDYQLDPVQGETGIYSADIREDATGIIFLRRDPNCSTPNVFDCWWNRADQSVPEDKNMFRVTGWGDNCPGEWVNYGDAPEPAVDVVIKVQKPEGWAGLTIWAWGSSDATFMAQFTAWPGVQMTALSDGWYKFTVKSDAWFMVNDGVESTSVKSQAAQAKEEKCYTIGTNKNNDGEFEIIEVDCSTTPTAVENTAVKVQTTKIVRDGQLIIVRDGVEYNAIGTKL